MTADRFKQYLRLTTTSLQHYDNLSRVVGRGIRQTTRNKRNRYAKKQFFIAYARTDESFLLRLREYLAPLERKQAIEVWYDGKIEAGEQWDKKIKTHLHAVYLAIQSSLLYH